VRTIVWFRGKDLRVADHAPLRAALAGGGEVVPLFVVDPYFFAPERARAIAHRMQFLVDSLGELAEAIAARGSRLAVVAGRSVEVVPEVAERWRADRVVAQRWCEPFARERDRRVTEALAGAGRRLELLDGETLLPPATLRTKAGTPFAVFTQFARAFERATSQAGAAIAPPHAAPRALPALPRDVAADLRTRGAPLPTLASLGIAREPRLVPAGEAAAHARLRRFRRSRVAAYETARDRMDVDGTSRLSQDLHFGTLSIRAAWHAVADAKFRSELLWREFAHHTLWDRPAVLAEPFNAKWHGFPYRRDDRGWQAWVAGTTGYPVVDAAARQLLAEGFVPNRARMIAASFLTKHLLIDYRRGEAHYLAQLTDGDWANNNLGWQWSAGCGCDAQPYFRVFNPTTQGERFDPDGAWVRRWIPELGTDAYPAPIVDHAAARERFLATARDYLRRRSRSSEPAAPDTRGSAPSRGRRRTARPAPP
jgi:deoxyribodipyrimidine photo-lyase